MDANELLKLIMQSGSGAALTALVFWLYNNSRLEAIRERERYISSLEKQNETMRGLLEDLNESPTRPIRPASSYVISAQQKNTV